MIIVGIKEDKEILSEIMPAYINRRLLYKSLHSLPKMIFKYNRAKQLHSKCRICKTFVNWRKLDLDHHYDTDIIRDVLCRSCNSRVGQIERGVISSKHWTARRIEVYIKTFGRYITERSDGVSIH